MSFNGYYVLEFSWPCLSVLLLENVTLSYFRKGSFINFADVKVIFLLCIFLNGSAWNFPNITVWLEKLKQCHFGGRRGRKGKDSEKGLCFLIKVRCRADFVSPKEHASFSPSVVLSSIGGSVEVPWRRECPSNSCVLYLGCLLSAEQKQHPGQTRENSE